MGLKERVENHPLAIAATAAVAAASITASALIYLTGAQHSADLKELENSYKEELSRLEKQLVSIPRRVGEGTSYFDISKLLVPNDDTKLLDSSYRTFEGGKFFVEEPPMLGWTYAEMSRHDAVSMSPRGLGGEFPKDAADTLKSIKMHIWYSSESIEARVKSKNTDFSSIKAFAAVQVMDRSSLFSAAQRFGHAIYEASKEHDNASNPKSPDDRLESSFPEDQASGSDELRQATSESDETSLDPAQLEPGSAIDDLFQSDIAAMVLSDTVRGAQELPYVFPGSKTEIQMIQRKANVLYMQSKTTVADIEFRHDARAHMITFFEEVVLVTTEDMVFTIWTLVPTIDGRSEAFKWISKWLAGIRVTVDVS